MTTETKADKPQEATHVSKLEAERAQSAKVLELAKELGIATSTTSYPTYLGSQYRGGR